MQIQTIDVYKRQLLASLLLGGCGKTETAAEIMSKVQANQQKKRGGPDL